ncbi:MAG: Zn-ribbon domain-containing OB-fold protein [Candidatus Eisenbacteria bacterium]
MSARYWREIPQRYRMEAARCSGCGYVAFPPRLLCPKCKGRKFEPTALAPEGKILTYTVIHVPAAQFSDEAPFAIGVVELDGGVRITAQIVDCDTASLGIGQRVRTEFRKIQEQGDAGILCYGYKCVPA